MASITMERIRMKSTDGGRCTEGFTHERRDCTVRALASAAEMKYSEAHDWFRKSGRKEGHGGHPYKVFPAIARSGRLVISPVEIPKPMYKTGVRLDRFGYASERTRRSLPSIKDVLPLLRANKNYYLTTRNHAFAIVKGVICDQVPEKRMRSRIEDCWMIETPEQSELTQCDITELWKRLDKLENKS